MTHLSPEAAQMRALWMAECWRPVREFHQSNAEKRDAETRNWALSVGREPFVSGGEMGEDGGTKDGPGGACDANPVLTPERDSEAPMNHAPSLPDRHQVAAR